MERTEISMHQAIQVHQQQQQINEVQKWDKMVELAQSDTGMFTIRDWIYYEEQTGESWQELRKVFDNSPADFLKDTLYGMIGSELDEDDIYLMDF